VFVEVWPLGPEETRSWLTQRMQNAGLRADREAVDLLVGRVEGNLLAAAQEVDKLALLNPGASIDAQAVVSAVADSARFGLYDLPEAALAGDPARSVRILGILREEGTDPVLVLWSLAREIRQLAVTTGRGGPGGGPERRRRQYEAALARLPRGRWAALLRRCARVDRVIKGVAPGRPWDELLDLILHMSGRPLFAPLPGAGGPRE
jgi:DNA polymerase-3 subunit delta